MKGTVYILGGGTISHVRNHLALCAPAFGSTAMWLHRELSPVLNEKKYLVFTALTRMADRDSSLVTNEDVSAFVDSLIADPNCRGIIFNMALVDFNGQIGSAPSGKLAPRLQTNQGPTTMELTPAEKIIGRIRQHRKDIFVVGFKTTCGATGDEQYLKGLELLKNNSLNLVVANDTMFGNNMIIAPEETRYGESLTRNDTLRFLVKMIASRIDNHFTRSTVVEGDPIPWSSDLIPSSLKSVVEHCISRGAYKPFLGKTAGHFAAKINQTEMVTTIRKTNFNQLFDVGMVRVESKGPDEVIAHGFRPSVGGQSQRIIFEEHPDKDCIVHFHCPPYAGIRSRLPTVAQWPNECGSHECGRNTSNNLRSIDLGDGDSLAVVYLEDHGPNIVFNRNVPPDKVIDFIEKNFDLTRKTGGLVNG